MTVNYYKPPATALTTPRLAWYTPAKSAYVKGEAKYDWNAACEAGVDYEHCISTDVDGTDGPGRCDYIFEVCLDYCFEGTPPPLLTTTPPPKQTLVPTPVPTTFMPTPLPTPFPTAVPTAPPTCAYVPPPTAEPTPCTAKPSPMPTPYPMVTPTAFPTPQPTL